ncbi:cysteine hydrolase family protein [Nigerium massiliense]|uniref:cysteine hydrolase family protein n=1 Tax=Nigerium massiliense TaxID=1522317 RepID=UPI00058ADCC4|nr:isochorismatase family protein [Nigerium massiliense]
MSTLDKDRTALLVIDVQNGVVAQAEDRDGVIGRIRGLVDRAHAEDVPVVFVQHSDEELAEGSDAWQIVDALRAEAQTVVHKRYGDAFEDTNLSDVLSEAGVGRLVVTGASTDACIRCTLHGGLARGYDVTLVTDAHTAEDMAQWGSPITARQAIDYANLYWSFTRAPGRTTEAVPAAEVEFIGGAA